MAQYIQHPALQGMEMGNRASQQRMNIYAQAVAEAASTINKEAAARAQAARDIAKMTGMVRGGFDLTGQPLKEPRAVTPEFMAEYRKLLSQSAAAQKGVNPNVTEGDNTLEGGYDLSSPADINYADIYDWTAEQNAPKVSTRNEPTTFTTVPVTTVEPQIPVAVAPQPVSSPSEVPISLMTPDEQQAITRRLMELSGIRPREIYRR